MHIEDGLDVMRAKQRMVNDCINLLVMLEQDKVQFEKADESRAAATERVINQLKAADPALANLERTHRPEPVEVK